MAGLFWGLEDKFSAGRPALEKVGVTFTSDVRAYEAIKIRILNGGHAIIAYPGGLMDIEYVHEAMANPLISAFLDKVAFEEIVPYVAPVPNTDLTAYYALIRDRFSNPEIADTERRLCLDGSNRQPKFIVPSLRSALAKAGPIDGLSMVSALWCRYCYGETDSGTRIAPNDPNWDALTELSDRAEDDPELWLGLQSVYGDLAENPRFVASFSAALTTLWRDGTEATLRAYIG